MVWSGQGSRSACGPGVALRMGLMLLVAVAGCRRPSALDDVQSRPGDGRVPEPALAAPTLGGATETTASTPQPPTAAVDVSRRQRDAGAPRAARKIRSSIARDQVPRALPPSPLSEPSAHAREPSDAAARASSEVDAGNSPHPPGLTPGAPSALVPKAPKRSARLGSVPPADPEASPIDLPGPSYQPDVLKLNRFVDEGGCVLAGQVLDADDRDPVAEAVIEVWMGNRSIRTRTDNGGRFRLDGLVPGSQVTLWVTSSSEHVQDRAELTVPTGRNQMELVVRLLKRNAALGPREAGVGLFLARRGGSTVVTGLTAWGPAERAGIRVGDVIVAVNGRNATDLGPGAVAYLLKGKLGSHVVLIVKTPGEAPRKLTLTRGGAG
jgi:hypothetical protein